MIYDSIKNAKIYYGIHQDIEAGLKYLEQLNPDIELGEYKVNNNVKAIVSEYKTVEKFERGYEAHKNVIDIQYPVIGKERIKWSHVEGMEINIPYEESKDRTFYKYPSSTTHIDIGDGFFAIMFPDDAHEPQHYIEKPELIKKVTLKVKLF